MSIVVWSFHFKWLARQYTIKIDYIKEEFPIVGKNNLLIDYQHLIYLLIQKAGYLSSLQVFKLTIMWPANESKGCSLITKGA